MAGEKEIRNKILSIKNTQKITKAMEMVAASKMRKAQDRMAEARPYSYKIKNVVSHLACAHPEYKHPFLEQKKEIQRVGFIVISTDRGLCGGLNINLFKKVLTEIKAYQEKSVEIDICAIGTKATNFFKRLDVNMVSQISQLGDTPEINDVIGTIKIMLDKYTDGDLDRLFLADNHFINTMSQEPSLETLLPTMPDEDQNLSHHWDYIYEPDSKSVIDNLLIRYIESIVYEGIVENVACEMAARMVAMKSASDNAGDLIDELQLIYNKARQASITQELSEIVGGAAAV
ncbi:MAG: F0F1 ATP synthase subunit gamma [Gammaproteobacteria bacterium]|nr:F0F1 ATP synthase subunit gamma [Gammaproteobacteria bacterium]|tara:strand:- start:317 stop:1180 length:864 start_codon:yes stop_codon:yes gene_type:complete